MDIQNAFDIFRRIALQQIINTTNVNINSAHIFNKIQNYVQYGNLQINSLVDLYEPSYSKVSLSDLTAKYMLAYLEMYSQYIINAGNSETILTLKEVSRSKYLYIINKYLELNSTIKEKEYSKQYKYLTHINFSVLSKVLTDVSSSVFNAELPQLSYNDLLSLPLLTSELIYPEYTTAFIEDNVLSNVDYIQDNKNVLATINRTTSLFIGNISSVQYSSISINNISGITFDGTINGYLSDNIYFKIESFSITNDILENLIFTTSIDGKTWDYVGYINLVDVNTEYDIYILEDIKTGIKFKLNNYDISNGQVWVINLNYIRLSDSKCKIKSIFNITKPLSFITFNDISEFPLEIDNDIQLNLSEIDNTSYYTKFHKNGIKNIIPVNNSIYSCAINTKQPRHSINSYLNDSMCLRYNFNISDITGYSNQYYKVGVFTFEKMKVENISTLFVDSVYSLAPVPEYNEISKTSILYSVIIENDYGTHEIQLIHSKHNIDNPSMVIDESSLCFIVEPVILNSKSNISENELVYDMRFIYSNSLLSLSSLFIINPYNKINLSDAGSSAFALLNTANSTKHTLWINTSGYINSYYMLRHAVNLYKTKNTTDPINEMNGTQAIWNRTNNRCAYMYYLDNDGNIKTALKSIDDNQNLVPFTGNIYGKIIMYSADESYISPYLVDLTFGAI